MFYLLVVFSYFYFFLCFFILSMIFEHKKQQHMVDGRETRCAYLTFVVFRVFQLQNGEPSLINELNDKLIA